jgi:hypothetical protein
VVTLTAKTGYTFAGVTANSFTYAGATVANAANSGTVTITFQATAAPGVDTIVNTFSLDSLVIAPVRGATPNTTAIDETQYTGTIAWQTSTGTAHTGAFAASTVYRAMVTLTAKTGYTFTGVAANSFTYTGATVTNAANSGTITITFQATAGDTAATVVNALSLNGLVTAPVTGATPNTTAINATQYTGSIAWQTSTGTAHTGAFAASTVYRAMVTLTAKTGYTFTGVAANSFTYTGATTVANNANSGTVTITFPATGTPGTDLEVQFSYIDPVTSQDVTATVTNRLAMLSKGAISGRGVWTIMVDYSNYNSYTYRWQIDGIDQAGQTNRALVLNAADYSVGSHLLTVIATRIDTGVPYSQDFFFVVVD